MHGSQRLLGPDRTGMLSQQSPESVLTRGGLPVGAIGNGETKQRLGHGVAVRVIREQSVKELNPLGGDRGVRIAGLPVGLGRFGDFKLDVVQQASGRIAVSRAKFAKFVEVRSGSRIEIEQAPIRGGVEHGPAQRIVPVSGVVICGDQVAQSMGLVQGAVVVEIQARQRPLALESAGQGLLRGVRRRGSDQLIKLIDRPLDVTRPRVKLRHAEQRMRRRDGGGSFSINRCHSTRDPSAGKSSL